MKKYVKIITIMVMTTVAMPLVAQNNAPPSLKVLKDRLVGRGTETQESIDVRTATALEELKMLPAYDYMVINDVVEEAVADMEAILSAELNRTARNTELITKLSGGETI